MSYANPSLMMNGHLIQLGIRKKLVSWLTRRPCLRKLFIELKKKGTIMIATLNVLLRPSLWLNPSLRLWRQKHQKSEELIAPTTNSVAKANIYGREPYISSMAVKTDILSSLEC